MLAGAYPSDEFAELKPRVVWDRVTDVVEGRRDARRRGRDERRDDPGPRPVRRVHGRRGRDARPARRRARRGDGLRATRRDARRRRRARREQLAGRGDQPRPGHRQPGARRPGQAAVLARRRGRAADRARAGDRARSSASSRPTSPAARRAGRSRRPACARRTTSTSAPRRTSSPTSRTSARRPAPCRPTERIVVERFRDELGDWRLCLLTPFGGRVHAPWSLAIEARLRERLGIEVQTIWSDDGIAIRLPEGDAPLDGIEALLFPEPDELEDLVVGQLATSALFASRFRENAARALLLPRRRPGTRTPLWQQRQRAADLLAVAVALRQRSRSWSRRTASACRTSSTCRRCARSSPASRAARSRSTASRPSRRRRSRAASCSTTSPPTCTTATRRWPSAGPAR